MAQAWIIAVGTELTLGQTVDTNSAWLAQQLAPLGYRATRHLTVEDQVAPLRAALVEASRAADLVVVTGGLGPTIDDVTRAALAAALDVELVEHPPSVAHLQAYFAARARPMPAANLVQTLIPRGADVLPNPCGTAGGLVATLAGTPVYVLPGVPGEMRAMWQAEVVPRLAVHFSGDALHVIRLNTFGLGEAELGTRLADLMARDHNPEVGTTAALGIIGIRIYSRGATLDTARTLAAQTAADIRARLGQIVFGTDDETLPAAVGRLIAQRGATLALAESCTGGLIGTLITDVPGSSTYFRGGIVSYANDAKVQLLGVSPEQLAAHGAVSAPIAAAMAEGAASRLGATHALAVTGIAGPGGGTAEKPVGLVFIGLKSPAGTTVREFRFGHDAPRDLIRSRTAHTALNLLRLDLLVTPA